MLGVCESACEKRTPKTKKLLLDIGAHVGETVHRFYRERPDAGQFDIYCFEPDPAAFKLLCANVGHIPNVACVNKALTGKTERRQLARGVAPDTSSARALHTLTHAELALVVVIVFVASLMARGFGLRP